MTSAALVRRKGDEHERRHLAGLLERYPGEVVEFERSESSIEAFRQAEQRTLEEMRKGKRVIYQATFFDGRFIGHADFLRRVSTPSDLGRLRLRGHRHEAGAVAQSLLPRATLQLQRASRAPAGTRSGIRSRRFRRRHGRALPPKRLHGVLPPPKARVLRLCRRPALEHIERPRQYPHKCRHCENCVWKVACATAARERRSSEPRGLVAARSNRQVRKRRHRRVTELAAATDAPRPPG